MTNQTNGQSDRVYELAALVIAGEASAERHAELEALLDKSAEARRAYTDFMQETAALKWRFGDLVAPSLESKSRAEGSFYGLLRPRVLALAAALLLAAVAGWTLSGGRAARLDARREQADPPSGGAGEVTAAAADAPGDRAASVGVATLTRLTDVQWRRDQPPIGELSRLRVGQEVRFLSGTIKLVYDAGVEVVLTGPCRFEILSASSAFCHQGVVAARVGESGRGFRVKTPYAQVVDLGTEFGLQVDEEGGSADVVVFKGSVDLEFASTDTAGGRERRRLHMGEGAQVNSSGTLSRIVSISHGQFGRSERFYGRAPERSPLILSVQDNIKRMDSMKFYEIVRSGMGEDVLAYVDRPEHQWNGVSVEGMPPYLIGGDYVKLFNDDKVTKDFEIQLSLGAPASLFVLFDDRSEPPPWLTSSFVDTGDNIGLDLGAFTFRGKTYSSTSAYPDLGADVGPGKSIENVLSVWRMDVEQPGVVRLGPAGENAEDLEDVTMYGIVATPRIVD